MKINYFLFFSLLGLLTVNAQVGTGFEEPNGATGTQRYTDANLATHVLVNNINEPIVQHTGTTELGFSSTFTSNGSTVGLSDGDAVGVYEGPISTSILGTTTAYASSGYVVEDPDGTISVEFTGVDLTATTAPRFQMDLFLNGTTYESTDILKIYLKINNAADFVILDTTGQDINAFLYNGVTLEETITAIDVDISAYIGSIVNLVVEARLNAAAETIMFDNVLFTQGSKEAPLKTNTFENKSSFKYYPNPVTNTLNFKSDKTISEVSVFNVIGQRVLKTKSLVNNQLNMSELKDGIYLVNVTIDNITRTIKVIKQ